MKLSHRLAAAIVGTSCMTAYSYAYSRLSRRQYREPILLSHLLSQSPRQPELFSARKKATAWLIHYGIGMVFSLAFGQQQVKGTKREALARGGMLGLGLGCVGVAGWQLAFILHPNPPKIKKVAYLLHLLPAHFIFGSAVAFTINRIQRKAS